MSRYYNDCLVHSSDYSDLMEFDEYNEPIENDEVLSRYWDDCIIHAGIKGQKWGQRRYQNEDGSYTEAGMMRRYGHGHLSGPRHFGSSKSSYRTGSRSSSSSAKRKGMSTKTKIALAAAGLAAAGAAGYAIAKRGRKVHDAQSEGWDARKANDYQRAYNDSVNEFNKAQSAWEKTRKVHGEGSGYRITDQGDPEARRVMEEAKNKAKSAGTDLIRYRDLNPEAVAKLRKEHKIGTTLQDLEAGIKDIKKNGLIDNSHKVTKDSLQKNFSSAFDKPKEKESKPDKVTKDSLQKNFSSAFEQPKESSKKQQKDESSKRIDASILTKEQQDDINKQIDEYNAVARSINERLKNLNNRNSNTPKSNLQLGPNLKEETQKETPKPKEAPKPSENSTKKETTKEPFNLTGMTFEDFDKMMSDPNSTLNLDAYNDELLKRNQKRINSIR